MGDLIGERMKQLRTSKGLSLRSLAASADVAVSILHYVENGTRAGENMSIKTAKRLAVALGVTLDYLCGMYETPQRQARTTAGEE